MEVQKTDNEVTLVLRDSRITAQKDKLANNSLYFEALFSTNFKDHEQKEFEINYDISPITLQTFVNWANNEGEHARVVRSSKYHFDVRVSLEKFLTGYHSELLELLNLSVIFAAEKLTDNITAMIICIRLHPDVMSDVWLLAEDLELRVLRDVAFANCLDRFEELSLPCLFKLSKRNFFRLVLNRNVNSSSDHMLFVIGAWRNNDSIKNTLVTHRYELDQPDNSPIAQVKANGSTNAVDLPDWYIFDIGGAWKVPADPVKIFTSDSNYVKRLYETIRPQFMPCAVGRKLDNTLFVWTWNGAKREIEEIAEMTDSQMHTTLVDNGKEIVGRQVIGRAFSIYLIGGEQGLGTGRFNTTLWRYCLFSKKWYIETILPQPRRHMAVGFLKNKLYLFGGVGRHRLKLSSVDVYDIYTGIWSQAADIPETFTQVPASCVVDGKFVYNKSFMYVYDPISDEWKKWCSHRENDNIAIHSMLGSGLDSEIGPMLFCSITRSFESTSQIDLEMIPFKPHETLRRVLVFAEWRFQDNSHMIHQQIWNEPWIVSFGSKHNRPYVDAVRLSKLRRKIEMPASHFMIEQSHYTFGEEMTNVSADCFKYRLGCFNIIDPHTLHQPIDSVLFKLCREAKDLYE